MSSFANSLFPSISERISRACGDLRLGLPCLVSDIDTQVVVAAIETLSQDRLNALRGLFGVPELVLTSNRAQAVMAPVQSAGLSEEPVRIVPPEHAEIDWFLRLADPVLDAKAGPFAPLHRLRDTEAKLQHMALRLVKNAELLPAILVFDVPSGTDIPPQVTLAQIDVPEALAHFASEPVLASVATAGLPVEAHDIGRLHVFREPNGTTEHYAFEIGTPDPQQPVLTRLHSACFTGDVLGSLKCDCGPQLRSAMERMGQEGAGLLLYLNQEGRGIGLANKMRVYDLQAKGFDTVEANHKLGFADDERDFRVAAVMLRSLGFRSVRLLTNNPAKVHSFKTEGVEVVEQLPLRVGKNTHNSHYLAVKALKSGHAL